MHADMRLLAAIYESHTACDEAFVEEVYEFLLGKRELNIEASKSTIAVKADYDVYITQLTAALDANEADVLNAMDTLIVRKRILVYPNPEAEPSVGWVDCIEVKDKPPYPLLELIAGQNPLKQREARFRSAPPYFFEGVPYLSTAHATSR